MVDRLTPERRSWLMSRVRRKNTAPELVVRHLVHGLGFRYRLHSSDLLGRPDLVFHSRRKAIFVHGCFWHHHRGCRLATVPKTNTQFWLSKFEKNRSRDSRISEALRSDGWSVLTIWQCQTRNPSKLVRQLRTFLGSRETGSVRCQTDAR